MKYSVQQIEQALKDGRSIQYVTPQNEQVSCRLNRCTNQVVFSVGHVTYSGASIECLLKRFEGNIWICTKIEGEGTVTNKPHKHADLIKKWADGAIIQWRNQDGRWYDVRANRPIWDDGIEYRVKPTKVIKYRWIFESERGDLFLSEEYHSELAAYKNFKVVQKVDSTMIEVEE